MESADVMTPKLLVLLMPAPTLSCLGKLAPQRDKVIRVEAATKQDFDVFYALLLPGAWSGKKAGTKILRFSK